ncbi:hypothetical protein [Streptomyces sp. NBC_01443]|uniref:hypothetical protein n=1 Tax=Streptomyces sp. NBC_01443 TaxID=2903868 RepID=UPI002251F5CF|nr:hypothetical protein [Streptomyces sp. NBC_01443]MCX4630667.1 hypothetical protein [Streptomyces sp. NBC_01443]
MIGSLPARPPVARETSAEPGAGQDAFGFCFFDELAAAASGRFAPPAATFVTGTAFGCLSPGNGTPLLTSAATAAPGSTPARTTAANAAEIPRV